ncbi:MAG: hypothetical protein ACRED5_04240 [Propylenella sp.]
MAEDRHANTAEEARRELEHLRGETAFLGSSAMTRVARKARAHFSAADAPPEDPAELWGRRIGRGLAVLLAVFLLSWLAATYLAD